MTFTNNNLHNFISKLFGNSQNRLTIIKLKRKKKIVFKNVLTLDVSNSWSLMVTILLQQVILLFYQNCIWELRRAVVQFSGIKFHNAPNMSSESQFWAAGRPVYYAHSHPTWCLAVVKKAYYLIQRNVFPNPTLYTRFSTSQAFTKL